jgi:hypothetical protein
MRKQCPHRPTLLRLLLRIDPSGSERVFRKCALALEATRLLTDRDSVEEIVDVDPNAFQCLPTLSAVCLLK